MSTPQRIQLRRTKGWRLPDNTVSVARPTRWGNPFSLDMYRIDYIDYDDASLRRMAVSDFRGMLDGKWNGPDPDEPRTYPSIDEIRAELAGKNLACWCPLVDADGNRVPCHADVLLELCQER